MEIQKRALLFVLLVGATTYVIITKIAFQSWGRYLVPKVAIKRVDNDEEFANGTNRAEVVFGTNVTDTNGAPWKQNG